MSTDNVLEMPACRFRLDSDVLADEAADDVDLRISLVEAQLQYAAAFAGVKSPGSIRLRAEDEQTPEDREAPGSYERLVGAFGGGG